jgi:hypothetical protein
MAGAAGFELDICSCKAGSLACVPLPWAGAVRVIMKCLFCLQLILFGENESSPVK